MYFAISLDAPQPPPYPLIRLDPPHVDFHWESTANLKVQCLNAETANCVLKERIRVAGNLVNVHKDLRQPMRCVKCHNYGHFKDSCLNEERCANCASDSHSTADCNNSN